MGGAVFTPQSCNWRFYADGAGPTSPLANENVKPTLANNTSIVRLRHNTYEAGGKAANNQGTIIEYSPDAGANWYSLGAAAHWDWADGADANGGTVSSTLLTGSTASGKYIEDASQVVSYGASSYTESDFSVVPTANVLGTTDYLFRVLIGGSAIPLGSGKTYPQVRTAAALLTKSLADTITLTDEFSRTFAFVREFGDTITLTDGIGKKVIIPRADTIILSDDITTQRIINLQLSDTITLSDVILKTPKIALADTITLNDAVAKLMSKGLADTITLSDVLYNAIKMSLSDTITLTDDMAKKAAVVLADQMTLTDLFDYIYTPGGGPAEKWMVYIIDKDTVVNIKL